MLCPATVAVRPTWASANHYRAVEDKSSAYRGAYLVAEKAKNKVAIDLSGEHGFERPAPHRQMSNWPVEAAESEVSSARGLYCEGANLPL
jgi:hypothetical protein